METIALVVATIAGIFAILAGFVAFARWLRGLIRKEPASSALPESNTAAVKRLIKDLDERLYMMERERTQVDDQISELEEKRRLDGLEIASIRMQLARLGARRNS